MVLVVQTIRTIYSITPLLFNTRHSSFKPRRCGQEAHGQRLDRKKELAPIIGICAVGRLPQWIPGV